MQYLKILLAVHGVECLTTCVVNYNLIKIKKWLFRLVPTRMVDQLKRKCLG